MGIYTRPDSPYFWMAVEREDGPPDRVSTGIPARHLTPEQWRANRKLALQLYAKRATDAAAIDQGLVEEAKPRISFNDYADWYQTHTIGEDERELVILKHLRAFFGKDQLDTIDRARTTEYQSARASAKPKPSARTINREVDVLKEMLRDAVPKYLTASPIAGMKRLKIIPPRRRIMTEAEEDKIVRVLIGDADHEGLALLYLGIDSLVRLGDLLDFQRDDDRGRLGWIQAPKDPRQPEPYTFPISKRARRALNRIPDDGPHFFSRFRKAKKERDWRGSVRQWLQAICARAGVRYGRNQGGITWHWATRRTGATRMIRKKTDLRTVQDVGHWKDPEVVLGIYAESLREDSARAVEIPGRRPRARRKKKDVESRDSNVRESGPSWESTSGRTLRSTGSFSNNRAKRAAAKRRESR